MSSVGQLTKEVMEKLRGVDVAQLQLAAGNHAVRDDIAVRIGLSPMDVDKYLDAEVTLHIEGIEPIKKPRRTVILAMHSCC